MPLYNFKNIHFILESSIYAIAYQMRWWMLILITLLRIDSINTGLIKRYCLF